MTLSPKRHRVKKVVQKAAQYEREQARAHRGRHVGGSGRPDYQRGEVRGEVKNWSRPMAKADVITEARKGRDEIISKRGFTTSARDYAERYRPDLRLIHPRSEAQKKRKR